LKKIFTLAIIYLLLISTFSILALQVKAETSILVKQWNYKFDPIDYFEVFCPSPAVANLLGGPELEIVTGTDEWHGYQKWHCFSYDGSHVWTLPTGVDESRSSVAIADIDGDGDLEIIGGTTSGWQLQVITHDGKFVWKFSDGYAFWRAGPAVADLRPEIPGLEIIAATYQTQRIWCFDKSGKSLWSHTLEYGYAYSTPSIGDVDNDGELEIIVGATDCKIYCFNKMGEIEWTYMTEASIFSSAAVANLDTDANLEIVIGSLDGKVYCLDGKGSLQWKYTTVGAIYSSPSVGDVDNDGSQEIIIGSDDGKIYCLEKDGSLEWSYTTGGSVRSSAALASRGTTGLGIYIGSMDKYLYLLNGKGKLIDKFYTGATNGITSSPAIADIDGDSRLEVLFIDWNAIPDTWTTNYFWCLEDAGSNIGKYAIEWQMFRHDALRTGTYKGPVGKISGEVRVTTPDNRVYQLGNVMVWLTQYTKENPYAIIDTKIANNGGYFSFESQFSSGSYNIIVWLSYYITLDHAIFTVYHHDTQVHVVSPLFDFTEGSTVIVNIDFSDPMLRVLDFRLIPPPDLPSSVLPRGRLDDLAVIYYHVRQVIEFERNILSVTPDFDLPIEIHAYSTLTSGAYYSDGEVYIGEAISGYTDPNRPMNREWHETFHELMDDTIRIPPYHEGDVNHGGYPNHCTVDSWVEGWAEFWPCGLRRQLGEPNPHLYIWEGGHTSFERNWRVWDTLGWWRWRRSVEEFAVASLLWDVIDPVNSADNDFISLSIEQLWSIIGSIPLNDMRDVYERFVSQNIGSTDSDNDGISDLDELFIAHGFFADANGNRRYDAGEEVGWGGRVGRRNTPPIPGAYVLISAVDGKGNFITGTLWVEVHFEPPNDIYDYGYEVKLEAGNNLIGFAVAPAEEEAIIKMWVKDEQGDLSDIFIMTNSMYWQNTEQSTLGYAIDHTFQIGATDKTTVLASMDFDPDVLSLQSKGEWATVYIELPIKYNVSEIDIPTVSINAINGQTLSEPLRAAADPKFGFVKDPKVYDVDDDGVPELMVKFERGKLSTLLSVGQYTLTIAGKLRDGVEFKGPILIKVIDG
jgi:hypothetical protein